MEMALSSKIKKISFKKKYIYYIHPELRIGDCRSGTGKGAGPLLERARREQEGAARREQGGSIEGALREQGK